MALQHVHVLQHVNTLSHARPARFTSNLILSAPSPLTTRKHILPYLAFTSRTRPSPLALCSRCTYRHLFSVYLSFMLAFCKFHKPLEAVSHPPRHPDSCSSSFKRRLSSRCHKPPSPTLMTSAERTHPSRSLNLAADTRGGEERARPLMAWSRDTERTGAQRREDCLLRYH